MVNPSFDTLKFRILNFSDHVANLEKSKFDTSHVITQDKDTLKFFLSKSKPIGIGMFEFYPDDDTAIIECSAKILMDQYFDGINVDTLDRFSSAFKFSGIELKPTWIFDAYVYRCDVTQNLKPSDMKRSLTDLNLLSLNHHYQVKSWKTSIEFNPKAKSDNGRLIFYGKNEEMMTAKNKAFIKSLPPKIVNQSIGILRAERNIRNFKEIRESLAIPKTTDMGIKLLDIFPSKEKPILQLFNKITKIQLPLFSVSSAYSEFKYWNEIEKAYGMDRIIESCGYDLNVVMIAVKQYQKSSNPSRIRDRYRKRIATLKASQSDSTLTAALHEILNQLAV